MGAAPLRAGRGHCPCCLAADKHRTLWAGHVRLVAYGHPCRGLAVTALVEGLVMIGRPFQGRKENRRGRPKLQPINHESPLLFIKSHQKS
ncbi:hypothetical protein B296_00047023 [Ensete ventricosum]|uniref:Uncharacterized protein n=1 Tax=Ensete ventricosum TaxID=4639 RepID=A0A426YMV9_ENSVE|nr:hypothetical protein B296_00047023 [Ensete ventricosum]